MKLSVLLRETGLECGFGDTEISSVTADSRKVIPGSLFVAVEGRKTDGHKYAAQAISAGAAAVVTCRKTGIEREIITENTEKIYGRLCSSFYGHPEKKLKIIGITGTNGKTTTAEYLAHVMTYNGAKCGKIGTLGIDTQAEKEESGYTTPECDTLFSALDKMARNGCGYCVMEVSSQALAQARTDALSFSLGVFTNLGRDHLDYHGSVGNYVKAKSRLFRSAEISVLNAEDPYSSVIAEEAGLGAYFTYSSGSRMADCMARKVAFGEKTTDFMFMYGGRAAEIRVDGIMPFTVDNALAAASSAIALGTDFYGTAEALCTLPAVNGRCELISAEDFDVYIDYAHTPEALKIVTSLLRNRTKGKLICVFGCGGERDREKRPLMGAVAAEYSQTVIITNDNPRSEDPEKIISDIKKGIRRKTDVYVIPDRREAIAFAISLASPGDTVLVAGKGHEAYSLGAYGKKHFNDAETVKELLGVTKSEMNI